MVGLFQIVALAAFLLLATSPASNGQSITVTLLGTGCPPPVMERFGPSILVKAGTHTFLFDAGRGAMQRLAQTKTPWRDVTGVFLTHLHSDHLVGLPDLWLTGWIVPPRRAVPLKVWGPSGTVQMMSFLTQAFEVDLQARPKEGGANPLGAVVDAKDISEGVVFEDGGVKVTAFNIDHGPEMPGLGYRVDYEGHSVVLSGDTRFSENLVKFAQGTDVLIHEVVSPEILLKSGVPAENVKSISDRHTTPEEAGRLFALVAPGLAVYSHIVHPSATERDLVPPTRKYYSGPLEVGEDLMTISIGDKVEVQRPKHSNN